ncbi:hypothetical protein PD885_00523 [Xanthomonas fragariae]|uniref:Uncharacterized protein n=1 Tax=Xanthomonas fragariae TaxID=48664 RepID=A0ABY1RKQ1_9XANT|nr:hypothetical protein PD885_00523 [Xanthomonas fragariae]
MPINRLIDVRNDCGNVTNIDLHFVHTKRCLDGKKVLLCPLQALSLRDNLRIQLFCLPAQQLNLPLQSGVLYDQPLE